MTIDVIFYDADADEPLMNMSLEMMTTTTTRRPAFFVVMCIVALDVCPASDTSRCIAKAQANDFEAMC